ncbi:MAG: monovalent cation/H(+) antiporter subunit G [Planctomycetota bacterium]
MQFAQEVLCWSCLIAGALFSMIGGIGIVRFPDFYSRLHGGGISDTAGAGLILLGLMIRAGFSLVAVKLGMILFFLMVVSPSSCHALAKSAMYWGVQPALDVARGRGKTVPRRATVQTEQRRGDDAGVPREPTGDVA